MAQPLPKATPELAKKVWARQRSPSARSVARALTLSGRPVHYVTVNRWRRQGWRAVQAEHPLDRARADLESMLALDSGNPLTNIDDLSGTRPKLASRSWPRISGRAGFLVRQPRWPRAIGKATFGKVTCGTPYSPSSSGWFGFMANNNTRNVGT